MRCCEAWEPVGKCFDPISFECVDFQSLSQIIANLTREHLAEREAEITSLPWTQTGERQCAGQMQSWTPWLGVPKKTFALSHCCHWWRRSTLGNRRWIRKKAIVSTGRSTFQARVEGPRHQQHEEILRYVQQAPDDIRWTIDQAEFDDLLTLKKDSAPGPDGIPYGAYRCAWGLGSKLLFKAYKYLLEGGAVPDHVVESRTVLILKRPLTSMTMEEFFDLQTRFVLWRYAIVIAHFSLLLSVEASIGTPRDTYILRRDVSLPGIWQTTFLRSGPPLWLMLRALRRNQASYCRTLLPPIPASITPGSSPWLRKQNCLSLSAASYEVFENDSIHRPPYRFSASCRRVTVPRHAAHTSSEHSNAWKLCVDAHYPMGPNKAKHFPTAVCPTSLAPCLSRGGRSLKTTTPPSPPFSESISIPKHCMGASTSRQWFGKFFLVVSLDGFFAQALLDMSLRFSRWSLLCTSKMTRAAVTLSSHWVAFPRSSFYLRHRPLDRPGSSVAILAQAISCSNVHDVRPVHELFWFCFVQVSTTEFCCFPSVLMARASDGTDMPENPLPASSSNIGSLDGSLPDLEGTGYRWRFPF